MKQILFIFLCSLGISLQAQRYTPEWSSLDNRPLPAWFQDSKFGIFIHWGVYSVPAWAPVAKEIGVYDRYAEWYWSKLTTPNAVQKYFSEYHLKTYGPYLKYQDFAPQFRAELFQPDQWAELFKAAGAKYVVLTSKHHEGFALWPSAESWNWNSADVGPHRDLCGDLSRAVKEKGLHMGFYYSLYEWFNPLYKEDLPRYVDQHMIPQMKDLVTRYHPDLVWTDGEWDHPSAAWKSEEFLAWLYNESPVKETVVVNDRWGKETRSRHGGFYTTEYGLIGDEKTDGTSLPKAWEECRGIGTSFGLNRAENLDSYSTSAELIKLLVSTVAAGGNLLLDIGPAADGTIPVIMQQRLLDMGGWLNENGEAIYGTRAFMTHVKKEGIHPEAGKTIFFTQKGADLYVICLNWPREPMVLKGLGLKTAREATLLGLNVSAKVQLRQGDLVLTPPSLTPEDYRLAYVFKLPGAVVR